MLDLPNIEDSVRDGYEKLGIEYQDKAKICKINTDEEQDLAIEYEIRSIPTILFFKDGKKVNQILGVVTKAKLKEELDKLIG